MAAYRFRAARADGRITSGRIDAATAAEAGAVLFDRGLHALSIAEAPAGAHRPAASRHDLALVFRSIASLVGAGVPLERAVAASEPLAKGALKAMLVQARQHLREGRGLAGAVDASGMVPPVVIGMLRAGERGSRLGAALDHAAAHLEHEAELAARLKQALAYPLLLAVTGTASVLVIGTVVVPRFAALLADLGQALPLSTRLLLGGSAFLTRHGLLLAAGAAVLGAMAASWTRGPAGELAWHRALLHLPVVRAVRHALATARLCRALGGMLAAGLPLLPALEAARDAAGDRAVAERLGRARERVTRGEPLSASLGAERAVTPMALELLTVGESSGRLAAMADRAGEVARQEAERSLRTATTLIEPALIVSFGGVVALVAAALLQAVYSIRPGG
jgi:general secretion pathway protein F